MNPIYKTYLYIMTFYYAVLTPVSGVVKHFVTTQLSRFSQFNNG